MPPRRAAAVKARESVTSSVASSRPRRSSAQTPSSNTTTTKAPVSSGSTRTSLTSKRKRPPIETDLDEEDQDDGDDQDNSSQSEEEDSEEEENEEEDSEEEDSEEEQVKPPTRSSAKRPLAERSSTGSKASSPSTTSKPTRSTRNTTRRAVVDSEDEDDEQEQLPQRQTKSSPQTTKGKAHDQQPAKQQVPDNIDHDDDEDDDDEDDDDDDEIDQVDKSLILADPKGSADDAKVENKDAHDSENGREGNESDSSEASFKEASQGTPKPSPADPTSQPTTTTDAAEKPSSQPETAPSSVPAVSPQKRLVIHKMVLNDFKSYAGKQEIGPFHKSFSSVVGPNGSGKSNVIDSLLFVFGWRANKMRQGKLSELIHNSAGKQDLSQCSVEVWFRKIIDLPGEAYKVVPGSKLIVSRTAYRNNSSQYFINNRRSNFTEVTTLLKGRGIDLDHKRFLILQGEVESIAQMPPKAKNEHEEGLLEYLEDIIGTSCYKTPIEEQAKLVDEANERRAEKLARLKIVQKEKVALEAKKRQAEEYLRDQNELTQRQSALWQVYILECKDQMKVASSAIESLKAKIQQETEKHAGSMAEMEALQKEYDTVVKDYETIAKGTEKVVKELAKFEKEDVQLQEKRKHLESKKKKLAKTMGEDKRTISEARTTATGSAEQIEKFSAELSKLESSLEKEEGQLEKIRDSLKGKTQGFSAAIEAKQKELQPWTTKINEKVAAHDVAKEERDLLASRTDEIEKGIQEAKEAVQDLELDTQSKREEVESLKREQKELEKKVASCGKQLQDMQAQETQLRSKVSAARSKVEEARASVNANRSRGDILSSLARQAELGMIKGFHGRLGNLGVIDDKYDVAISTACPGLNNIVVQTVDCGQSCIEHLRKNNLGRANFILLNSLGVSHAALSPIQTPENVPRLFDLVKPRDPNFAPAFYHQLRDTLVANDLEQANRIAYGAKRWRVVTLDGQLIDKSGTMSGGGTRVSRGSMSSKFASDEVSPEQLQKMERERDVVEEALRSHVSSMRTVESLLDGHKKRVPQIEISLEKIEMDLASGEKRVTEATQRVAELKAQSKPDASDAKRIAELDKQVASLDKDIAKLSEKTESIEKDIANLQEKILEAGGVELRTQKSKVDGIKEMMDLNSERITKAEVNKAKAEKDVRKLDSSIEKSQNHMEALEQEITELLETIESKSKAAQSVRSKVEEAQEVMKAKQEERDEIKVQLDERSETANGFRALEMEIKQKAEDNERSYADNEKRLKHWQEKLSQLVLHHIDPDSDDEDEEDEEGAKADADNQGEDQKRKSKSSSGEDQVAKDDQEEEEEEEEDFSPLELEEYPEDELRAIDKESIKAEIVVYEEKVAQGSGNLSVLAEYRRREQEFISRAKDLEATTEERDLAKRRYDDLRKQRLENFMAGFSVITAKLKEMYQTITLGGNAELELVDSLDPFSEGIIFSVMPPKKSWKNISNLSGGEKTLSSLALVFALHVFKPTPLYVMDEIDAALDFRNVSIVANLIKERTRGAQFIIISLRNNMFELSSRLVGVYKTANCTKSIAIDNTDLLNAQKQQQQREEEAAAASMGFGSQYPAKTPAKTPGRKFLPPSTPAPPEQFRLTKSISSQFLADRARASAAATARHSSIAVPYSTATPFSSAFTSSSNPSQ